MEEVRGSSPLSSTIFSLFSGPMFHALVQHIEPLIQHYGALGVFLASVTEEMIAPIPSTLVVFTAGLILAHGLHGKAVLLTLLLKVILPASAGMSLGSLFPYFIARAGEKIAIERFGKYVGIDASTIDKVKAWSSKTASDEFIIFGTRAVPGIPTMAVSILAGLAQIPVFEYLLYTFLGCLVRTSILSAAGWFGGRQYGFLMEIFSNSEDHILVIALAVLFSALAAWIVLKGKKTV